ncbi:ABC transporter ATP-binding protein [Blautia liquoris]|uniref:ABC transporter ATP-binding protein n=1 Tax=Blautia liquoris TaxID=2779518 RepID=A0A7M2REP6_9FIRM|nr:ABC transporter ATP-binding protein [Blautia liquoris]QOV18434.1 ABC transporter ATP-binding protein [Blautia liquoris]
MKLTVNDLSFSYKTHRTLDRVNFSADTNQCVCLLGENGAGKTTLFRCILGLLGGYKGEILIDGADCRHKSVKEMARLISYIPQANLPTFNYTVFQTVLMGTNPLMDNFHTPGDKEREIVFEKLDLLGITHLAERGYANLSGGERQLVLIARALVQDSDILIMDEPTANLDYGNQYRIMEKVKKLADQGYLVLLSTHNPEHALLFADQVVVLKDNHIIKSGPPKDALDPEMIQNIYGVKVELKNISTENGMVPVFVPCLEWE